MVNITRSAPPPLKDGRKTLMSGGEKELVIWQGEIIYTVYFDPRNC
jgi:hypothetical protein